jgi:DNA-binding response OmpR family regulator
MARTRVLIVDDEKNIRLTVGQSLEAADLDIDTAVNGEEALEKLRTAGCRLVLLDLKLPGIDGMDVLRELRRFDRDIQVVIITAHGTVDNAVEAMKLGAVDFIQKPFTPDEIRTVVAAALSRKKGFLQRLRFDQDEAVGKTVDGILAGKKPEKSPQPTTESGEEPDYEACLEQAKAAVECYDYAVAASWAQRAIFVDTSRPDAYNFLGVLLELQNKRLAAQKYYRAALALDPTFEPAQKNLTRSTQLSPAGTLHLGAENEVRQKGRRMTPARSHGKRNQSNR